MRWRRGTRSAHVEDRRGGGGSRRGVAVGGGSLLAVLAVVVFNLLGGGSSGAGFEIPADLGGLPGVDAPADGGGLDPAQDPDADLVDFVEFVVDDVQASWTQQFESGSQAYRPATLVLFDGATDTGCGLGDAAIGPFYCPLDEQVYVDLSFFRELSSRFGAPGDFAQAYVIAHEFGHHVQQVTGISDEVRRLQQERPDAANDLSVRLELQADCLAGVWAHGVFERDLLETGDLDEGLDAAAAVGDDTLQRRSGGQVNPESWTHGSAEQRATWFRRGFDAGRADVCDTFA